MYDLFVKSIKSKNPVVALNSYFESDVALSLMKWIPQVLGLLTGMLGAVHPGNAQASEAALQRSARVISVPEYLRIQPDKLIKVRLIGKGGFCLVYFGNLVRLRICRT